MKMAIFPKDENSMMIYDEKDEKLYVIKREHNNSENFVFLQEISDNDIKLK